MKGKPVIDIVYKGKMGHWVIKVYNIECIDREYMKRANRRRKVYVKARAYVG